jgi:uncharacterized protein YkwD
MPRLIRTTVAAFAVALLMGVVAAGPAAAFDRRANERAMLKLVNHARVQRGLKPVAISAALQRAALSHSRDMLARGFFGHSSLSGASVKTRAGRAGYSVASSASWSVGEVIAWGTSYRSTPESVFKGWMRSSAHRRVILCPRWRDVGIGCAGGTFQGSSGAVMYTADFGRR